MKVKKLGSKGTAFRPGIVKSKLAAGLTLAEILQDEDVINAFTVTTAKGEKKFMVTWVNIINKQLTEQFATEENEVAQAVNPPQYNPAVDIALDLLAGDIGAVAAQVVANEKKDETEKKKSKNKNK